VTPINILFAVPREGGNSSMIFLVQMGVIFSIFYFLLLRPQASERKRLDQMLSSVKKGDEVVTNGGIIGTVVHVEEQRLTIKTGENTRLTIDRSRLASVVDPKAPVKGDAKAEKKGDAKAEKKGG
jgi:preprotein translocase subunit YajC